MSFETELLDALGTASDAFDIKVMMRRCFFYDFDGASVRLWDGQGVLNAGGYEWLGTIDANGQNHHNAPEVKDGRDGTSPRYEFTIPYLDKATFTAMKADQDLAIGRDMICYHALFRVGEGLAPETALRFNYRMTMRGTQFGERIEGTVENSVFVRSATVMMRSGEHGRSRMPNGTYTDTAQVERARLLGFDSDSGCSFVAANSNRTFILDGG